MAVNHVKKSTNNFNWQSKYQLRVCLTHNAHSTPMLAGGSWSVIRELYEDRRFPVPSQTYGKLAEDNFVGLLLFGKIPIQLS